MASFKTHRHDVGQKRTSGFFLDVETPQGTQELAQLITSTNVVCTVTLSFYKDERISFMFQKR